MGDSRPALARLWLSALLVALSLAVLSCDACNGDDKGNGDGDNGDGIVCPDPTVQNLPVSRYTTASLTDAEANSILADATAVLQNDDSPPADVSCCVRLETTDPVGTFTTGDGSIDSSAEFSAVISLSGYVKVVNQINWCGTFAPNIIGCAPVPGSSFAVVRFTASQEGILWAHEYGHTKGLSHRNDTSAIMNPSIGASRLRVTQAECDAFKS